MSKVQVTVEVPKEANDVRVLIVELVKDIKAKKDVSALAAENLANLMAAIEGLDQLPAEAKSEGIGAVAGLMAGEVADALLFSAPAV